MNILAIHASHNGSISIAKNNELIVHAEAGRFYGNKFKPTPSLILADYINELNLPFDKVLITNFPDDNCKGDWIDFFKSKKILVKKDCWFDFCTTEHHIFHASCANTFNKNTDYLVWDGNGAKINFKNHSGIEQVSFYRNNLKDFFSFLLTIDPENFFNERYSFSLTNIGIGEAYTQLTRELEMFIGDQHSEGKAMALSSYGTVKEELINKILFENNFNRNYIAPLYDHDRPYHYKVFNLENPLHINNIEAQNLAATFQKCCEFMAREYVSRLSIEKDITATGGVAQNILINSMLNKELNFKIHIDPICNDQGISLGRLNKELNFNLERESGVYLGFKPKYDIGIFNENFTLIKCNQGDVAKILKDNPIALFQGRSEQGQRALGNRSLIMNATHPNCIQLVNKIKKREWYRPFAASILYEKIPEWFEEEDKFDSEFMMFAYKCKLNKIDLLQNVIAPDNTCRIQGVKKSRNENYYNLIKAFDDLYSIPFILNTSLNLPGFPIVETLNDLKRMMLLTSLKYAYLPEINTLVIKNEN